MIAVGKGKYLWVYTRAKYVWVCLLQVKPLLQVTRQEEELTLKEEELQKAKDSAQKYETELKDIVLKHTQVMS